VLVLATWEGQRTGCDAALASRAYEMNGFRTQGRCAMWGDVEGWLAGMGRIYYPASAFAAGGCLRLALRTSRISPSPSKYVPGGAVFTLATVAGSLVSSVRSSVPSS